MIDKILWSIIEITNTFLSTLITYWFLKDILGLNPSRERYKNILGFFALFLSASIIYLINPNPFFTLIYTLVSIFLLSMLFDGNIKSKSFISIISCSIEFLSELIAVYTIMILSKASESTVAKDGPYRLAGIVISIIIFLVTTRMLSLAKNRRSFDIPTLYWLVLLITPALSILIMYTVFSFSSISETPVQKILSYVTDISLLLINFIIYYLFNKLIEDFNIKTHYKLLKQQIDFQVNHYKDLEMSNSEIRSLRHDIKNHLQCLNELIRTEKKQEAQKYIQSVADILTVNNRLITTGNSVLDSILNAKLMVINEKNINFNYTIEIPREIKIEPVDICILFGNSLDNAIEACERVISDNKSISMIISYKNNSIVYSLSNSTDGRLVKNGKYFLSSKNNYSEHGLGLSNIERTVEKYNGILKIEHENEIFRLSTVLYNI
jgi:sensor histidine kinase YesM